MIDNLFFPRFSSSPFAFALSFGGVFFAGRALYILLSGEFVPTTFIQFAFCIIFFFFRRSFGSVRLVSILSLRLLLPRQVVDLR